MELLTTKVEKGESHDDTGRKEPEPTIQKEFQGLVLTITLQRGDINEDRTKETWKGSTMKRIAIIYVTDEAAHSRNEL